MSFYTYMLRCSDGSYYVGHTDDLDARFAAHQSGLLPGYTHKCRPVQLVWHQEFAERDQAFCSGPGNQGLEPSEKGGADQGRLGRNPAPFSQAFPALVLRYAALGGYSG